MSAKVFPCSGVLLLVLVAATAAPLVVSPAAAQSTPPLAEVARKEAERRKGIKEGQKVITNKDLPESARKPKQAADPGTVAGGSGPSAAPADAKTAAATGSQSSGQKDEAYWRGRITQARENLRRNEAFAEALQSRINGLTTDFVNRDDPYQRAKIGEDRQKALEELARVKSEIETNRKTIDDVEEEARKAGVPPGWLR